MTRIPHLFADLIRMIMKDAKNFDTRAWIVAVGIVLGAFVVLSLGICIVLYKEWQESDDDMPGMNKVRSDAQFWLPFCLSFRCLCSVG